MTQQSPSPRMPRDFSKRMRKQLSSDAECYELFVALDRLSRESLRALRVNSLRLGAENWVREQIPLGRSVPWEPQGYFVESGVFKQKSSELNVLMGAGAIYVQEPGAMEAVSLLDPQPGEQGLDLCAAPGGKSTQIVERLAGRGWLVSNEVDRSRAARLDALLARHGSSRVSVYSSNPEEVASQFEGVFDFALVDAPCSGESLFAKREERRSDVKDAEVRGCARRQLGILSAAARSVRSGGRLVYSTCTYSAEENEDVIAAFLSQHPHWKCVLESRRWPHRDGMAGGYAARLEHQGEKHSVLSLEDLGAEMPPRGLIRHRLQCWDGQVDLYAQSMWGEAPSQPQDFQLGSLEDAGRYLRGEALMNPQPLSEAHDLCVRWQGWALGPGRRVEGRVNNLLPKILRSN